MMNSQHISEMSLICDTPFQYYLLLSHWIHLSILKVIHRVSSLMCKFRSDTGENASSKSRQIIPTLFLCLGNQLPYQKSCQACLAPSTLASTAAFYPMFYLLLWF